MTHFSTVMPLDQKVSIKFWGWRALRQLVVQNRRLVVWSLWSTNRKSYMAYRI